MTELTPANTAQDQDNYQLPVGVVGVLFGPRSHIDRALWFITHDGNIRSATLIERAAFLNAFPHYQTTARAAS